MRQIVVGVSGATGIILAYKLVDFLTRTENIVHLVMSRAACKTAQYELGEEYASPSLWKKKFSAFQQTTNEFLQSLYKSREVFFPFLIFRLIL